ncbi:hypothetical protein Vadar_010521 [Vaccinium darrowii]|uniref:Uncharacterized protein n=1 Tax=Vaccinium darrowii TaxID=229202 RepID=A0ACB7XHU4_9ERIC|nr:hypothetical protein Vadar_010521 [Vaccinium darrowii]
MAQCVGKVWFLDSSYAAIAKATVAVEGYNHGVRDICGSDLGNPATSCWGLPSLWLWSRVLDMSGADIVGVHSGNHICNLCISWQEAQVKAPLRQVPLQSGGTKKADTRS